MATLPSEIRRKDPHKACKGMGGEQLTTCTCKWSFYGWHVMTIKFVRVLTSYREQHGKLLATSHTNICMQEWFANLCPCIHNPKPIFTKQETSIHYPAYARILIAIIFSNTKIYSICST